MFRLFSLSLSLCLDHPLDRGCTDSHTLILESLFVSFLSIRCQAISDGIQQAEQSRAQGLVLSSSMRGIFSAGLDLTEMYQPDQDRLVEFWVSFQQVFLDLYGSSLATVAAIEGHSPAGGCLLAMACDYRIMANHEKIGIGLNEAQFGIVAPPWMAELMQLTVGQRVAESALQLGTLYNPQQALRIGLIDEVAEAADVQTRAAEEAQKWSRMPPVARATSKQLLRKPLLDKLNATRQMDTELFLSFTNKDSVQQHLGKYLASLKGK